ncbi:choice-of-anchor L domain-containing protein [Chondromyces crocatus]|uniref:Uncharacterized protein n=1 Tax=Chondromyces crocatus TaxID=52 RepID=A0A0K1EGP5_CHOCO|nr:choice-of-anchor L domain-containing protein [Chondromyces crocatus]AKT39758.1 uncharacterized protein CMC5_039090 [Chondromyces crocatus]
MSRFALKMLGIAGVFGVFAACSATKGGDNSFGGSETTSSDGTSQGGHGAAGGDSGEGGIAIETGSGGGGSQPPCIDTPGVDDDGDGFADPEDCNDCDPNVNPAAMEVMTAEGADPVDEDCDGEIDNIAGTCDENLLVEDPDPMSAVRALDICRNAQGPRDWGLLGAAWVRANGTPLTAPTNQYGIQPNFGPNVSPRGGDRMLAISSGRARLPGQTGACTTESCNGHGLGTAPSGFPQSVTGCPVGSSINDDVGLQVHMRAPSNATGLRFNFRFYSFEYPEFVCMSYNDQFIALMNPAPAGAANGNISFDSMGNPVSVNVAFFDVCEGCPLGIADLLGTGFDTLDDAGATGWLATTAPVKGGQEVSLRFAIWDTGDQQYDSTALIDNFEWIATGGTVPVGTTPEPQ